ncbi:MAG: hypothetical protein J6Y94_04845 [Bacteriovoracaceae bacterium]|nr:hypothetical protein [Bacteriovoracaceae bacterium]
MENFKFGCMVLGGIGALVWSIGLGQAADSTSGSSFMKFVQQASQEIIQQKKENMASKVFANTPSSSASTTHRKSSTRLKATPKVTITPYRSAFQSNQRSNELLSCLSYQEDIKALNPPACLKNLFDKRMICYLDDEAISNKLTEYIKDVQNTASLFETCYPMRDGSKALKEKAQYQPTVYDNFQKQIQKSLDQLKWIDVNPSSAFAKSKKKYADALCTNNKSTPCSLGEIYRQALAKNKLASLLDDMQNLLDLHYEGIDRKITTSHQVRAGVHDLVEWLNAAAVNEENGRDARINYLCPRDMMAVEQSERQEVIKPHPDDTPTTDPAAVESER